jgi:hypothetical protein
MSRGKKPHKGQPKTINAFNVLERTIMADPDWIEGAAWGKPRRGHPEGMVLLHIQEVLDNIDQLELTAAEKEDLRLIALIHDTFKHKVDTTKSRVGENHHAMVARRFAEKYIPEREDLLEIIELHDEAYNSWQKGNRDDKWDKAEVRARNLLRRLGPKRIGLYLQFYHCDNHTGNKGQASLEWFIDFCDRERC